ncbi:MAG: hypothetical protein K6T17_09880, partial [Fimbriimonadales bacterium]|nr:hypothetical protein [Fimbriimonadales bacterium]
MSRQAPGRRRRRFCRVRIGAVRDGAPVPNHGFSLYPNCQGGRGGVFHTLGGRWGVGGVRGCAMALTYLAGYRWSPLAAAEAAPA